MSADPLQTCLVVSPDEVIRLDLSSEYTPSGGDAYDVFTKAMPTDCSAV